jgi:hypothetical protein
VLVVWGYARERAAGEGKKRDKHRIG